MFQPPSWEDDTDEFLKSMLTGSDLSGLGVSGSEAVCPSDTSSDSGCPEEQVRKMTTIEKRRYLTVPFRVNRPNS